MSLQAHPIANEYPKLTPSELADIVEGMKLGGFDPLYPILLYEGKILDGRHRYTASLIAEVEPVFKEFVGTEEEALFAAKKANEHRRDLGAEWRSRKRQERIERVAALRREGESTRIIAEKEGVSLGQIQRDLKEATVSGDTVEPEDGKVRGRDGRVRTATPKRAPEPPEEADDPPEPDAVEETLPEPACAHIPPPRPAPPPRYPHSEQVRRWLSAVNAERAFMEVDHGGITKMLADRSKWDPKDMRGYILPHMEGLVRSFTQAYEELSRAFE